MTHVVVLMGLLAAASSPVGVAVSKRSGVNRALAQARAEQVRSVLGPGYDQAPIDDFTVCAAKLPCVVKQARDKGWSAAVLVETANVLDDALINVTLISIDDDGRKLEQFSVQAPEPRLGPELDARGAVLRSALLRLFPEEAQPTTPPVVLPAPPPMPPPVAAPTRQLEAAPATPSKPVARWVPLGVGVLLLGGGVASSLASEGAAARLKAGGFTSADEATLVARDGQLLQTLGLVGLISGGALTAGGLILGLAWPDAPVQPVVSFSPQDGRGLVGVQGALP